MKIRNIRTIPLRYRGEHLDKDALAMKMGAEHPMDVLIVEVESDDGRVGRGECYAYGALSSVSTIIQELLAPLVLGRDPRATTALWERMYQVNFRLGRRGLLMCALSGVDTACWDLAAQDAGVPLWKFLGGEREVMPAYVTGGYYRPGKGLEELREEVRQVVTRGFRGMKLKIGGIDRADDVRRLEVVREEGGDGFFLGVDANNALTYPEALWWGRQLEALGVDFFEEPIPTDQPALSARLARDLDVAIAGYETETSLYGMRDLIVAGAVDIVQADCIWAGGITEVRRIADLGRAFGLPFIPHYSAGALALVANLHLAAATPGAAWQELHLRTNPLRDELLTEPLKVVDGQLRLPSGPGLGVTLNPDTIEKYRVD
ncbi:mandelate racemase/muconate lactonizing enzyme family protein [Sulfobacillus harzensis]|uniref:Mandelate racemase/muconate lactonizing enzyme family protein n=1 Tax=Sulfobacillus harzensis TaxID=2729629 RepID=A0A7Y0Q2Q3_9FIRM|nr:mandelate racemase/muconate lactonizing enzyme family protein [Sulfobacillus harzensis]NMP21394.1 mandelate racemase/muconate lactonizing enzyme family protein [Sulfobacillus harzensis]